MMVFAGVSLSPLEQGSFNTEQLSAKLDSDTNIDANTDANTDVNTDANTDEGWYLIVQLEGSHCHQLVDLTSGHCFAQGDSTKKTS